MRSIARNWERSPKWVKRKEKLTVKTRQDGTQILFLPSLTGAPMCLLFLEMKPFMKDFNLNRHHTTAHKEKYERYTGDARTALISDLKGKIHCHQNYVHDGSRITTKAILYCFNRACESQKDIIRVWNCKNEMVKIEIWRWENGQEL